MTTVSVSGDTRVCGIIGDPIEHTVSPLMHNAAFKAVGADFVYVPFRVKADELAEAIDGMRALGITGLNVTIPHKVAVLPLLNELDPLAEKIGAVNTIVNDDGVLTGYNTDAGGFLRSLSQREIDPKGKQIVILGAGGAARAICFALAERGAFLTILNRAQGLERARRLLDRLKQDFSQTIEVLESTQANLKSVLKNTDMLVNTTSVGMTPKVDDSLVRAEQLHSDMIVFDIVYNPTKTRLLKEAEKAGAMAIRGIDMLVWQGALAFEKWTGLKAPVDIMRREILRALEKYEK